MQKVDQYIYDKWTEFIRRWIKKQDYKKHKIDFYMKLERLHLFLLIAFGIVAPTIVYIIFGYYFSAGFQVVAWGTITCFWILSMVDTARRTKPRHDLMFSLRKNPAIYNFEKAVMEELFEQGKKSRASELVFFGGFTLVIAIVLALFATAGSKVMAIYFILDLPVYFLKKYTFLVFDFEEPKPRKKAKKSLSEIILRSWQELIGGLAPQPAFARVWIKND